MAFRFFELPDHYPESGANPPSLMSKWKAIGTTDVNYVHSVARAGTPSIMPSAYGMLYRQDIRVKQTNYNQFIVNVPYGLRKNEVGEWTWDFDTTGGTIHISNSKESIARYPTTETPAAGDAPDQKGGDWC